MTVMIGAAASCIDGRWIVGDGEPIASINPGTGRQLALTPSTSPAQVAAAVSAARRAFDGGEWSRLSPADRGALLHRFADLLVAQRDDIVALAATEIGTPVSSAADLHVDLPAKFIRWFADAAVRGPRDGYEQPLPLDHDPITSSSMLLREPVGVVAAIVAYNVPVMMCAYKLGAALAAGCSTVLVTSPRAILLTSAIVRLFEEAGFPSGAVNLVFGPPGTTTSVVEAPEVDMVSFTGSAAVGSKILALAAPTLKKVVLELGGKSPNIVLPGTDLARAVPASVLRFTRNSGQACGATTRTLVPRADFDEYVQRSVAVLRGLTVGDPLAPDTVLGPLITGEHRAKVEGFLSRARESGARLPVGGGRPAGLDEGFFLEATLVTHVPNESEIAQEELFAPVGVVMPYADLDEAVRMANDSRYALNANVWGPTAEAIAFGRRLRSGTVTVNGGGSMRADAPWGGPGHSGIGREGGEEGLREFFEIKHMQWPL
ncbi:aldehyde dehydrogenase family protein [Nocardia sp. alder85J]|uniref:aldehyde dehydrogenase family protein n=1 Tax=Nocardia sp. alder85J TaxID=2862949 RepID=UPI001CD345E7|nr:aldehyde dehydrogenase family protein [Nocardia sp. alder85J]MCX4095549.1 aldehyde dehydrogenase family protein [Nocardia sp. alder85J]